MTDKDYRIRFAGEEIPAYQAWKKLEIAHAALAVLEKFNLKRTSLATDLTREKEEEVKRRLAEIEVQVPSAPKKDKDLTEIARALMSKHAPEDVMDVLRREHGEEIDINGLIHLAGTEAYLTSLANEVQMFSQNAISYDQAADLWNEAKRPAPEKPFWTASSVKALVEETE